MHIFPSELSGELIIPPSKSHSQRALLFSMLASGTTYLNNLLFSPDIEAMVRAITLFGAKFKRNGADAEITGGFYPTDDVIDAGNSGQVLRFIGAVSALLPSYTTITGDASVRTRRPIKPLLGALRQLGALAESARGDGRPPLLIKGPIHPGKCRLDGQDSQPVSALLIATSLLKGSSEIFVDSPGETPWIDMTLSWLRWLGAIVIHQHYSHYIVQGGLTPEGFEYSIPGDFSTAAFPLVAALITGSSLELIGLDPRDIQGDKILISHLQKMGASIFWDHKRLCITPSNQLVGMRIDVNSCIDALPILAVFGCFAEGKTTLYNGAIARTKESDRISCIAHELRKMGAQIEEHEDGLTIWQSALHSAELQSHRDHRIALALAVAALGANSPSILHGTECIAKTYPTFVEDFQQIGAKIELDPIRV